MSEPTQTSPDLLSTQQLNLIANALTAKGAARSCHRCGAKNWSLENGLVMQSVQAPMAGTVFGGPTVPMAMLVCTNCGVVNYHALGALGLLHHPAFGL